jgi:hypothetical protein
MKAKEEVNYLLLEKLFQRVSLRKHKQAMSNDDNNNNKRGGCFSLGIAREIADKFFPEP